MELAVEAFHQADVSCRVEPTTTREFPRPAPRPSTPIGLHSPTSRPSQARPSALRSRANAGPPGGAPPASGSPWKRRVAISGIFGSVSAKIMAGVVVAAAASGSLAASGKLPAPVQNAVAGAAGGLGVNLPNPHASQTARAKAATQAQKVVSTVSGLVQQVSNAAQNSTPLTASAARSAGTCTENVAALATQLGSLAALATTQNLAQSLAAHATALAQESVGCALPPPTPPVITGADPTRGAGKEPTLNASAFKVIAAAVESCSVELKSSMQTLVQTALTATTPGQVRSVALDAKAVATAAQACAQGVGTALNGLVTSLPASQPPLPVLPAGSASLNLPKVLSALPSGVPTPPTPGPAGASKGIPAVDPASLANAWTSMLATVPPKPAPGPTPSAGTGSPGPQTWAGLTGSWTGFGFWNPYAGGPSPWPTGGSPAPGSGGTSTSRATTGSAGSASQASDGQSLHLSGETHN
ncbi:MAG: hypothetical protein NVSMB32_08400 [Actinomycetota bacterium]